MIIPSIVFADHVSDFTLNTSSSVQPKNDSFNEFNNDGMKNQPQVKFL